MERVKEIWSYIWSKLVVFGTLLKKWFIPQSNEEVVDNILGSSSKKLNTKVKLRKKIKKTIKRVK